MKKKPESVHQRTKALLLSKGLPVAPAKPKKPPVPSEVEIVKDAPRVIPVPLPVENHGTTNDLARSVIFSRVKGPVSGDLSKSQFRSAKTPSGKKGGES